MNKATILIKQLERNGTLLISFDTYITLPDKDTFDTYLQMWGYRKEVSQVINKHYLITK